MGPIYAPDSNNTIYLAVEAMAIAKGNLVYFSALTITYTLFNHYIEFTAPWTPVKSLPSLHEFYDASVMDYCLFGMDVTHENASSVLLCSSFLTKRNQMVVTPFNPEQEIQEIIGANVQLVPRSPIKCSVAAEVDGTMFAFFGTQDGMVIKTEYRDERLAPAGGIRVGMVYIWEMGLDESRSLLVLCKLVVFIELIC
jgi:hypothetical protein